MCLMVNSAKVAGERQPHCYLLIDSLRYELGLELEKQMVPEGCVQIYGACAMLPTVTAVGMASLLPGAGDNLKLTRKDNDFSVTLGERNLYQVNRRMAVLKERFGDRFAEMPLNDFVKGAIEAGSFCGSSRFAKQPD